MNYYEILIACLKCNMFLKNDINLFTVRNWGHLKKLNK